jgi:hypothetical protein
MDATTAPATLAESANWARYLPGRSPGHYESFFQRANHPTRPLAFWIRYTIFSPAGRPEAALGELWAIFFNGETGRHVVAKQEVPIAQCTFERESFGVQIEGARLGPGELRGEAAASGHSIAWDLRFGGDSEPLFLLPADMYAPARSNAKVLVGLPMAAYDGTLLIDGEKIAIEGWRGSQNHNWGERYTDRYAWGQVAGFDTAPDSFMEIVTVSRKLGPLWSQPMTMAVLRHQGQEYALNSTRQASRGKGFFGFFTWHFGSTTRDISIAGTISAPREAFVGLAYRNPPGGVKHCLSTKLATCDVMLILPSGERVDLRTKHRAAFEILTDDRNHGVPISA